MRLKWIFRKEPTQADRAPENWATYFFSMGYKLLLFFLFVFNNLWGSHHNLSAGTLSGRSDNLPSRLSSFRDSGLGLWIRGAGQRLAIRDPNPWGGDNRPRMDT